MRKKLYGFHIYFQLFLHAQNDGHTQKPKPNCVLKNNAFLKFSQNKCFKLKTAKIGKKQLALELEAWWVDLFENIFPSLEIAPEMYFYACMCIFFNICHNEYMNKWKGYACDNISGVLAHICFKI